MVYMYIYVYSSHRQKKTEGQTERYTIMCYLHSQSITR